MTALRAIASSCLPVGSKLGSASRGAIGRLLDMAVTLSVANLISRERSDESECGVQKAPIRRNANEARLILVPSKFRDELGGVVNDITRFVVETERTATALDHEAIRPFVKEDVKVTCLREEGAKEYGWDLEARQ